MTALFADVLIISLEATVIAAVIIFIKKLFSSKINVRTGYLLWALLLVRLIFPILPQSPVSIFNPVSFRATNLNFVNRLSQAIENVSSDRSSEPDTAGLFPAADGNPDENRAGSASGNSGGIRTDDAGGISTGNQADGASGNSAGNMADSASGKSATAAVSPDGASAAPPPGHELIVILAYIWAAGVLIAAAWFITVNALFSARIKIYTPISLPPELAGHLKAVTKISRPVRFAESESITSPCVFGVIRSTVLLPKGFLETSEPTALSHILLHEFAHLKHGDLTFCWLTSLIRAIHWFNPVIWYCAVLMKRDQELCADAYAMSLMDEACISEYGRTLLSAVVQDKSRRHAVMTAGITENRRTMKQRIRNVAAFSKKKYRLTLAGVGLILSAAFFLCTSQVNYPQTALERMAFDDRIQMAVYPADVNNPRNMNVQIFNRNPIAINSCELEIFNGRPDKPENIPVYSNKNFRIGGNQFKSLSIEGIDFNSAYIRFNFKVGFAFDQSNMTFQSGDMACFDKTYLVNGRGPATDDETSDFIRGKNIKASSVNQLYGFLTVILFENGDASGYYELYRTASKSSGLSDRLVRGYGGSDSAVQMLGGSATGPYPFINLRINHPALLALGDKIQIETANGTITRYVSRTKFHCIPTKGYGGIHKILIYDKAGELLYDGSQVLSDADL